MDKKFKIQYHGALLIKSTKCDDGECRLFLTCINEWNGFVVDKHTSPRISVQIDPFFVNLICKTNRDDIKLKRYFFNSEDLKDVFNMSSSWIFLNDKKTPLWTKSTNIEINIFLKNYKNDIFNLSNTHNIFFDMYSV